MDKFADKYHDKVYDHLPAWKQKQQGQQQAKAGREYRQDQRDYDKSANEHQRSRRDSPVERSRNVNFDDNDRDMSSYARSAYTPSYAPNVRQDYRDDRAPRYVRDESIYYKGPNAGAIVMRDNEATEGRTGYDLSVRQNFPANAFAELTGHTSLARLLHRQAMEAALTSAAPRCNAADLRLRVCALLHTPRRATNGITMMTRDVVDAPRGAARGLARGTARRRRLSASQGH